LTNTLSHTSHRLIDSNATIHGKFVKMAIIYGVHNRTVNGTNAADELHINGRSVAYGRSGDDVIYGSGDNNRIYGQDGNDTIHSHGGRDEVWGGRGNDALVRVVPAVRALRQFFKDIRHAGVRAEAVDEGLAPVLAAPGAL
jgi:hypothetical protein